MHVLPGLLDESWVFTLTMEGGKVYPLIMETRPNLKVIVFSGYSIDGPARKILDAGAHDFIQKPFSLATLSEKLKKVLEEE